MNKNRRRTYVSGSLYNEGSAYAVVLPEDKSQIIEIYGASDGINFKLIRSINIGVTFSDVRNAFLISKSMTIAPGNIGSYGVKTGDTITDDNFLIFSLKVNGDTAYYSFVLPISDLLGSYITIKNCLISAVNDYGRFYIHETKYPNSSSSGIYSNEYYSDDLDNSKTNLYYWNVYVSNNYDILIHTWNGQYCMTVENGISGIGLKIIDCTNDYSCQGVLGSSSEYPYLYNIVPYPTKSFVYKWNDDYYNDEKTWLKYSYLYSNGSRGGGDITRNTSNGSYRIDYNLSSYYGIKSGWDDVYRVSLTLNPSSPTATYGSEVKIPIDGGSRYLYNNSNWGGTLQSSSLFTRMKYYCDAQSSGTTYVVMSNNGMQSCVTCTGFNMKAHLYYQNVRVAVHPDTVF